MSIVVSLRVQQAYDHRPKLRVFNGDVIASKVTARLKVPRSTVHGWKKRCKPVVSDELVGDLQTKVDVLQVENSRMRDERDKLRAWFPSQLTAVEVATIREMVLSEDYRHVPTKVLAKLAARLGKVHASASSWRRLIRLHRWRRPRTRVYPKKPTIGIRADAPNKVWYIDTSIVKLIDGTKVYLRAVIDNLSRRFLAYKVQ